MLFWTLAGLLGAGVALILTLAALRGGARGEPAAAFDLRVYRDQLGELDRDLARGVLGRDDAERARLEISRRVLEADRAMAAGGADSASPRWARLMAVGTSFAVVLGGGLWLYATLGAPGYPDLPIALRKDMAAEARAARIPQAEAEARAAQAFAPLPAPDPQFAVLMEQLRSAVATRPDDLQGLALLARNEAAMGNLTAAVAAQDRLLTVRGADATAEDHAVLADLMVLAAGGYVSPQAEAALDRALAIDPGNGTARYYKGLSAAQTGRPDIAFALWRNLLETGPADAAWVPVIRDQIGELAALAGVDYTPPADQTAPRGPSAADIDAASEMSEADRQAMIRSMVDGLSDRLAAEGGPAADWARLIGALGVLKDTDRARAIWSEAQGVFAGREAELALIRAAAEQAGVAE